MRMILLLISLFAVVGCTDAGNAERVLGNQGYSNVLMTGYSIFACAKDDFFHTGFTAELNGRQVSGTVCSGLLFKNSTVRFE